MMLLAQYEIHTLVIEQINHYLKNNSVSFDQLKTHLINKTPLADIQCAVEAILTKALKTDQDTIQKKLEKQYYDKQVLEDTTKKQDYVLERSRDETTETKLTSELNQIKVKLEQYEQESARLHLQLSSTPDIDSRILSCTTQIRSLKVQQSSKEIGLAKLKTQTEKREAFEQEYRIRAAARAIYEQSKTNLAETLTQTNKKLLARNIKERFESLEKQCADLTTEATQLNYSLFVKQLDDYLKTSTLPMAEVEALRQIIRSINQHLEYEKQAVEAKQLFTNQTTSLGRKQKQLAKLNSALEALQKNQPQLSDQRQELKKHNLELATSLRNNSNRRWQFGMPALVLFLITLLFTIPLVLIVKGLIPAFIEYNLLLALVATPTAILFAATLVTGIIALAYALQADKEFEAIKTNFYTIEQKLEQEKKENEQITVLKSNTIPKLEEQIKKDLLSKELLDNSLEKTQNLSFSSLKRARDVEPLSLAVSPFLESNRREIEQPLPIAQAHVTSLILD